MIEKFGKVIETNDGSLSINHPEHNECYHSREGALLEARKLYIENSGFIEKLESGDDTCVLDVGLGLGYNALSTIDAWFKCEAPGNLKLVSLEINPDLVEALSLGNAPWQDNWSQLWITWGKALKTLGKTNYFGEIIHKNSSNYLEWLVIVGDASKVDLRGLSVDNIEYVWQDPFSPEKNPKMWNKAWFEKILPLCSLTATLATYSVARKTRDALSGAGWSPKRIEGYGTKRHWLLASPTTK